MNELDIFNAALEIASREERQAYLDRACGDDAQLRQRVEELLKSHDEAGSFMNGPTPDVAATEAMRPIAERPGMTIGPYKLMEQVGEGGMGVVYVAEQRKPVRRKVALKIIKPGMDSKDVIARFEAERQALALMDHPNIAKVLDAGATESGRPYFVMELVRGITITEYCDQNNLTTRERLDLFVTVCHAIKHAHQKGVIHRDVKPSNVMVTLHDGKPVPKIIDFGVAKAINQQLTEQTIYTQYAQMVGTPLYMSPEQAEMSGLDVDTRTDIYSLGVLLYELLTGTTPFDKQRFRKAAYDEVRRIIREEEPPKPSTRISTIGETDTSISAHHKSDPRRLSQMVRGDLDWIVMKALEKDRTRRYETANDLAADILRHINNEPILASPPSVRYGLSKFARRNKAAMATIGLVSAALVLGLIISTWQAIRATKAEKDLASAHGKEMQLRASAETERDRAVEAEQAAKRERDRAEAQRDENSVLLYRSDIASALHAWDDGAVTEMIELTERHRPAPGETDLRGFEWYHLWRLCGQKMNAPTLPHTQSITDLDFSPDGKSLATTDFDGNLTLWELANHRPRARCDANYSLATPVVFSPNGRILATAGFFRATDKGIKSAVHLWDAATGRLQEEIELQAPLHAAFSPDGSLLAIPCHRAIEVWDLARKKVRNSLRESELRPSSVAFSPDGKKLIARYDYGTARLWDLETGQSQALAGVEYYAQCVAFSPDGESVAVGDEDGTVRLWDVATVTQRASFRGPNNPAMKVAFSPDGSRLGVATISSLELWDVGAEKRLGRIRGGALSVAFSPDGNTLASGAIDSAARLWRVAADEEGTVLAGHKEMVICVAVSPDGELVASGSYNGGLKLWDAFTGCERATLKDDGGPTIHAKFSPDGSSLVSVDGWGMVTLWEVATGRPLFKLAYPGERRSRRLVLSAEFSPDGKTLFTGDATGKVELWDAATGTFKELLEELPGSVVGPTFSADGKTLATLVDRNAVMLWDAATGEPIRSLGDQAEPSGKPAFSPDSRFLACVCRDGTVRMWDAATGNTVATLEGHISRFFPSVAFSPDGTTLFAVGSDGTIKLWDTETHLLRASLKGDRGTVVSVAISPDGATLVSGGTDKTVRLWRAAPDTAPEKLAELLHLEDQVRAIWKSAPAQQQQVLAEIKDHMAKRADTGLSDHDIAAAKSTAFALRKNSSLESMTALSDLSYVLARSDDRKVRELAESWQMASWRRRAELHMENSELEEAIVAFNRLVELRPDDVALRLERGSLHVRLSQWKDAAADHVKAAELEPNDSLIWLKAAPLLILADDQNGYTRHGHGMLKHFGANSHVGDPQATIKTCLLLDDVFDLSKLPLETLTSGLDESSDPDWMEGWGLVTRALAAYRTNDATQAVHWVRKFLDRETYVYKPQLDAQVFAVLAMAQHQLKQSEDAQEALTRASDLIDAHMSKLMTAELGSTWHDWLIAEILRREASALLEEPVKDTSAQMEDEFMTELE